MNILLTTFISCLQCIVQFKANSIILKDDKDDRKLFKYDDLTFNLNMLHI